LHAATECVVVVVVVGGGGGGGVVVRRVSELVANDEPSSYSCRRYPVGTYSL
jgi:hypothetical protein